VFDPRKLLSRYRDIFVSRGGIGRALIMGAGWSSTLFVGCAFSFHNPPRRLSDLHNIGYVLKSWEYFRRVITRR
jgi:hypothetical protein